MEVGLPDDAVDSGSPVDGALVAAGFVRGEPLRWIDGGGTWRRWWAWTRPDLPSVVAWTPEAGAEVAAFTVAEAGGDVHHILWPSAEVARAAGFVAGGVQHASAAPDLEGAFQEALARGSGEGLSLDSRDRESVMRTPGRWLDERRPRDPELRAEPIAMLFLIVGELWGRERGWLAPEVAGSIVLSLIGLGCTQVAADRFDGRSGWRWSALLWSLVAALSVVGSWLAAWIVLNLAFIFRDWRRGVQRRSEEALG